MFWDYSHDQPEQTCFVANCNTCIRYNQCIQCRINYTLVGKQCLKDMCSIYGKCKYCNEYDCVYCNDGYELKYGYCMRTEDKVKYDILLGVVLPLCLILLLALVVIAIRRRRKRMAVEKVISAGNIVGKKRLKNGQYVIFNSTNINNIATINIGTTTSSTNMETSPKASMNASSLFTSNCIVCASKKIYSFAQCVCALCKEHFEDDSKVVCSIHGVNVCGNMVIKKHKKHIKKIKEKEMVTEGNDVKMCPVCKIMTGTVSFNCGCPVLLCDKCFNDNVFVFKFNKCPGCNKPYSFKRRESLTQLQSTITTEP